MIRDGQPVSFTARQLRVSERTLRRWVRLSEQELLQPLPDATASFDESLQSSPRQAERADTGFKAFLARLEGKTGWVAWSNDGSVSERRVSLFAAVETLACLALYWIIAAHFHTHWHLLVSASAAIFLLLRTQESVALGLRLYRPLVQTGRDRKPWWFWAMVLLYSCLLYFSIHQAIASWLLNKVAQGPISGAAILAAAVPAIWAVATIGTLVRGPLVLIGAGVAIFVCWVILVTLGTIAGSIPMAAAVAGVLGLATALATVGYASRSIMDAGVVAVTRAISISALVLGLVTLSAAIVAGSVGQSALLGVEVVGSVTFGVLVGLALWALVAAVVVRFCATLRYSFRGLRHIGETWKEIVWCTDPVQPPKLLPHAEEIDRDFTATGIVERFRSSKGIGIRIGLFFLGLVWWVPAMAYRWSIKSTAWCWWWLVYLTTPPFSEGNTQERRAIVSDLAKGRLEYMIMTLFAIPTLYLCALLYYPPWNSKASDWSWLVAPVQMMVPTSFGVRAVLLMLFAGLICAAVVTADRYDRIGTDVRLFWFEVVFKLLNVSGLLYALSSLLVGVNSLFPSLARQLEVERLMNLL